MPISSPFLLYIDLISFQIHLFMTKMILFLGINLFWYKRVVSCDSMLSSHLLLLKTTQLRCWGTCWGLNNTTQGSNYGKRTFSDKYESLGGLPKTPAWARRHLAHLNLSARTFRESAAAGEGNSFPGRGGGCTRPLCRQHRLLVPRQRPLTAGSSTFALRPAVSALRAEPSLPSAAGVLRCTQLNLDSILFISPCLEQQYDESPLVWNYAISLLAC